MTILEFIVCICALKLRHNLTNVCISDILRLISIILPRPNKCPSSFYKFKKYFSDIQIPVKKHYYCSNCIALVNNSDHNINHDENADEDFLENIGVSNCDCSQEGKKIILLKSPFYLS